MTWRRDSPDHVAIGDGALAGLGERMRAPGLPGRAS